MAIRNVADLAYSKSDKAMQQPRSECRAGARRRSPERLSRRAYLVPPSRHRRKVRLTLHAPSRRAEALRTHPRPAHYLMRAIRFRVLARVINSQPHPAALPVDEIEAARAAMPARFTEIEAQLPER